MNLLRCCWEFIDRKNTSMDQKAVKNLLVRQKVAWWIEEAIERLSRINLETSMDRDCDKICWDKKKEGLDRRESVRICREAIELQENEFFKEEKHEKMNATSKLLKHRSNQHIKLSKHLLTYMQSIQDPKHTHTLNKSNQIYISKTS